MNSPEAALRELLAGRYAIDREIGRGGMATVFLAEDVRHKRQVAVKVLHVELTLTVGAERFLQEIRIAASLTHPHILPLHDSGEAGSYLYYVMPFIDGESLRDLLARERRLDVATAESIVRQVAGALAYAHDRGFVHRDIKPENILLADGQAVLADFGIAKAFDSASSVTQTGLAVGSPRYMSPEQAASERDIDGRSDLYSLGCVFFEMLIGQPPFSGTSALAIMAQHATAPLPSMAETRAEISAHIEAVVATLMAKAPADRYATARDLVAALDSETSGGRLEVARQAAGKVVGTGSRKDSVASVAVLPFSDRSDGGAQAHLCDGIPEDVLVALGRTPGLRIAARTSSFRFRSSDADIRTIGRELNVDAVLSGSVQRSGDRLRINVELSSTSNGFQIWSKRFDGTLGDVFAMQDEIAGRIATALGAAITESGVPASSPPQHSRNLAAYEEYLRGRKFWNKRHEVGFRDAIASYQKALELDPLYALPYSGLADAFSSMGAYGYIPSTVAWERARAAATRALELDPDLAAALTSISLVRAHVDGQWVEAERGFRRSMELDPNHSNTPLLLSFMLSSRGRHDEAIALGRQAAALEPANPVLLTLAAYNVYRARRYDDAIRALRVALAMMPAQPVAHAFIGISLMAQGKWNDALPELEESRTFPPTPGYIAHALARIGRTDDARRELRALEEASTTTHVPKFGRAIAHLGLGEHDKALALLEECAADRTYLFTFGAVDPLLDEIRGEPRFTAALTVLGLDDVANWNATP